MGESRPLGAKLFLEGLEVPFLGATITSQVGSASIAYIDVLPHAEINHVKPRTHVMIAVRDYRDKAKGFPYVKAWEGEVFGYTFNKTPMSRSMSLSCIDFTSYWDNVLTYYMNPITELSKGEHILPIGLDAVTAEKQGIPLKSVPQNMITYFKNLISSELKKKDGDLLDGLVKVIQETSKINDFYKVSSENLKINDRLQLHSSKAITKLFPQREALEWFMNIVSDPGGGGFTSLRETILKLMSIIFHDQVTIPFPSGKYVKMGPTEKISKQYEFVFKPNLFMVAPPMCNVFYPDEYSSFTFSRNFLLEPTRLAYRPVMPTFGSETNVALPHVYSPENFDRFMYGSKKKPPQYIIDNYSDFGVPDDQGYFLSKISDESQKHIVDKKREQHFMTNEERIKGIMLTVENMVPATSGFVKSMSGMYQSSFSKLIADYMLIYKRYKTRELQITSHLKLSVVPGFPALILDDSPANHNMVAYVNSVTHRIYATEGGYTNVVLSFARTATEQQSATSRTGAPLIPPWFEETIFGKVGEVKESSKTTKSLKEKNTPAGAVTMGGEGLTDFYKSVLGPYGNGSKAVTDIKSGASLTENIATLLSSYSEYKKTGEDVMDYISSMTDRSYIPVEKAFEFINATTNETISQDKLVSFTSSVFTKSPRRPVCETYQNEIKGRRAFNG